MNYYRHCERSEAIHVIILPDYFSASGSQ